MQLLFVLVAVMIVATLAFAAIMFLLAVVTLIALACLVGLPIYFVGKRWLKEQGFIHAAHDPLDRLKALYVEGKIDMFEFERRAAALIAIER